MHVSLSTFYSSSQSLKELEVVVQCFLVPDLLELPLSVHPVLCWAHLEVVGRRHRHAVGTSIVDHQAITLVCLLGLVDNDVRVVACMMRL